MIMDYGSVRARFRQMRYKGLKEYFIGTLREMHLSARSVKNNPLAGKKTIDPDTLAELETYAISLGVADMGCIQSESALHISRVPHLIWERHGFYHRDG